MSFVPRWSIARRIKDQSVAEHTFYAIYYTHVICVELKLDRENTLKAMELAVYHDMEEIFTGDIPGPAKRILAKEEGYHTHITPHVKKNIPTYFTGNEINNNNVVHIVKMASLVDEAMWMATESQLGNKSLNLPMNNTIQRLYSVFELVFNDVDNKDKIWAEILNDINRAGYGDSRILLG